MKMVFPYTSHNIIVITTINAPLNRVIAQKLKSVVHIVGKGVIKDLIATVMIADEHFASNRT